MNPNALLFSFFDNKEHPAILDSSDSLDGRTFHKVDKDIFGGFQTITFVDRQDIDVLFQGLEIIEIYNHKLVPIVTHPHSIGGSAEYIVVSKRS
jgi:hypothetical protein